MDGDYARSEAQIKRSLELDDRTIRSHYYLGLIYMKKSLLKEAEREFNKEIELYPRYDGTYAALGVLYYKEGRPKDAERLWLKAFELNPGNAEVNKNLAIYYYENGKKDKSIYHVEKLRAVGARPPAEFLKLLGID